VLPEGLRRATNALPKVLPERASFDPMSNATRPLGSIDLGTQSALLLIAERRGDGGLEVLEDHAASARLGAGAGPDGQLAGEAVERCLEVLRTFQRRLSLRGIEPSEVRCAGTAILRRSPDAAAFVARVRRELGFDVCVVGGPLEARLGFLGAFGPGPSLPDQRLLDLGGGSTELCWSGGAEALSVPYGAVFATDRLLGELADQPIGPVAFERLVLAAREAARGFPEGLCRGGGELCLIGGSASNLACLDLGLESFDPRLAEGRVLGPASAWRWARRLAELDLEARRDLGIEPDRARTLPAALVGLGAMLERLGAREARVTGRGLRHGLLLWPTWPPAAVDVQGP
jgi:exopolyphosphatase/guanosine-5'-triphosphate,3'-diphosphate pyrophosphatase